jgi:uncharacterized protein YgbK (DUF1537 family)
LNEQVLNKQACLASYPAYDQSLVSRNLQSALSSLDRKIVVLDDDPTGVQTVHGVYVYTDWSEESIRAGFESPESIFFILTNSRSFDRTETTAVHEEIARKVVKVSGETGRRFLLISRSDSTLRGHYPLETQVLRETLERETGKKIDGEVLLPFFLEGGRYTINNVHYVAAGDSLTPAGQTEFACDKTFGYKSSNLCEWIEEKNGGAYKKEDVICITLEELRALDYASIEKKLLSVSGFGKVIVNAIDYADVEVFVTALISAIIAGKEFVFRSAAALTRVLGGIKGREVLTREELADKENRYGGLILIGSHVKRTTQQLEQLKRADFITFVEFNQHLAVDEKKLAAEQKRVINIVEEEIKSGRTVAVYTRRDRLDLNTADREEELRLSVRISDAVAGIAGNLTVRPNFIIAKGGITSSDVGTKGLKVKKARVLGQILKGVPVWLTGPESKFPEMPYVIFPGNVGDENALYDAVLKLQP